MHSILMKQKLEYQIFTIEQAGNVLLELLDFESAVNFTEAWIIVVYLFLFRLTKYELHYLQVIVNEIPLQTLDVPSF